MISNHASHKKKEIKRSYTPIRYKQDNFEATLPLVTIEEIIVEWSNNANYLLLILTTYTVKTNTKNLTLPNTM